MQERRCDRSARPIELISCSVALFHQGSCHSCFVVTRKDETRAHRDGKKAKAAFVSAQPAQRRAIARNSASVIASMTAHHAWKPYAFTTAPIATEPAPLARY